MAPFVNCAALILGLAVVAVSPMVIISAGELEPVAPINNCAKGPEYWCSHISRAKECRAVKHCIGTVWTKQVVKEDAGDSICDICKEMVQEARDQLNSNETQDELRQVFEGSCKLIPIKLIRLECIKVSDDFIPELIEMLTSQMNPAVVCATAGLCNSEWSDRLQAVYRAASTPDVLSCSPCSKAMNSSLARVRSVTKPAMLDKLHDMCGTMSSLSDGCISIVDENIDSIYEAVSRLSLSHSGQDLCEASDFCRYRTTAYQLRSVRVQPMSNDAKYEAKLKGAEDDMVCEFCEALVDHLREVMVTNSTQEEFRLVIQGLCKQTGKFAKQCLSLADEYYDALYAFLLTEMEPRQICHLVTLCPKPAPKLIPMANIGADGRMIPGPWMTPAEKLIPAEKVVRGGGGSEPLIGSDEANSLLRPADFVLPIELIGAAAVIPETESTKAPGCALCEYVMQQVAHDLANRTIDAEIEAAVKGVCSKLPPWLGAECTKLVDDYGDAIIFILGQQLDPDVVCPSLKLCPGAQLQLPVKPFKAMRPFDPNTCALCEFVMKELERKIGDQKTEAAIQAALEGLCAYMPKTINKQCVQLVDAYTQQIVEMLIADLSPDQVCTALKLCVSAGKVTPAAAATDITLGEFMKKVKSAAPGGTTDVAEAKRSKVDSPTTCVMCEYAMEILEKRLITNSTEEQIKRTIDFLCSHLPSTVADMCIDFVETYGDEIFDMMVQQVSPKEVCTELGLCSAAMDRKAIRTEAAQRRPLLGRRGEKPVTAESDRALLGRRGEKPDTELGRPLMPVCEICTVVVEYLDKLLQDDQVEDSIDHIVEKACKIIPFNARQKCVAIVDTYGPYMLTQLALVMDKQAVCQSVHLCKPPPGVVQLLGGDKCAWGPNYWCVSQQHAQACNATQRCQSQLWTAEP